MADVRIDGECLGLAEIDRRLDCASRAIDLALAMRDRLRFRRACAVRAQLLALRAERLRAEAPEAEAA